MSEVNIDPNNYEFDRCDGCPGSDCTMSVRMAGAMLGIVVEGEAKAVEGDFHDMDVAADRIQHRLETRISYDGMRAVTKLQDEFGCGWGTGRLMEIVQGSMDFYDQNGLPPLPGSS